MSVIEPGVNNRRADIVAPDVKPRFASWRRTFHLLSRSPLTMLGLAIMLVVLFIMIFRRGWYRTTRMPSA